MLFGFQSLLLEISVFFVKIQLKLLAIILQDIPYSRIWIINFCLSLSSPFPQAPQSIFWLKNKRIKDTFTAQQFQNTLFWGLERTTSVKWTLIFFLLFFIFLKLNNYFLEQIKQNTVAYGLEKVHGACGMMFASLEIC